MRTTTALLAATLALGGGLSPRPSEAAARPPRLARHTKVLAARPSSIPIVVDRPATIASPFGQNPHVRVDGGGDLVFFALVRKGSDPFVLAGGRLPKTAGGATFAMPLSNLPGRSGWNYDIAKNYEDETSIPAGSYRLYVWPGGRPTTIQLTFDGLDGKTTLKPKVPARFTTRSPGTDWPTGGATENVYSAGASAQIDQNGLMFNALGLRTEAYAAGQFEFCHYEGDAEIEPVAYAPGCPNASTGGFVNNRRSETETSSRALYGGESGLADGRHGQGFWYVAEAIVEEIDYISLWLSY